MFEYSPFIYYNIQFQSLKNNEKLVLLYLLKNPHNLTLDTRKKYLLPFFYPKASQDLNMNKKKILQILDKLAEFKFIKYAIKKSCVEIKILTSSYIK